LELFGFGSCVCGYDDLKKQVQKQVYETIKISYIVNNEVEE